MSSGELAAAIRSSSRADEAPRVLMSLLAADGGIRWIYDGGETGAYTSWGLGGLALAEVFTGVGSSAGLVSREHFRVVKLAEFRRLQRRTESPRALGQSVEELL